MSSALTTGEGIVAGLIAGTVTTLVTNPVWTVQAYQSTRGVTNEAGKKEKPTAMSALKDILKQDGVKGLWRGIGPALILVINPVIQVSHRALQECCAPVTILCWPSSAAAWRRSPFDLARMDSG